MRAGASRTMARTVITALIAAALQGVPGPLIYAQADVGAASEVSLEQCLDSAMHDSPDARLSRLNLAAKELQLKQAQAQNALGLGATASVNRDSNPRLSGASIDSSVPRDAFQAGVELSGPLSTVIRVTGDHILSESAAGTQSSGLALAVSATPWDGYPGGKNRADVQKAQITVRKQRYTANADLKTLAYDVKKAYYAVLASQRRLGVLEQTLSQRRQELERIQAQLEQGSATRIDLLQAQVNARTAELDLYAAQDSLVTSREELSALVGWPLERQYTVSDVPDLPIPSLDVAATIARALTQRTELHQLELDRATGRIDVLLAKSGYSPSVKLTGGYSLSTDWSATGGSSGWTAGVELSVPVADSGLADAKVREAVLEDQRLEIQWRQQAASVATEVRSAINALRDLVDRGELAAQKLELARDQYEVARIQYESGALSTLDLLEASVTLTTAEVDLAKSRSDTQLGVLALHAAAGD